MLSAAAAVISVVALLAWPFQTVTQTETSRYPIGPHGVLSVETASGDITVRAWRGNTINVVVRKRAQTNEKLADLKVETSTSDGNLTLRAMYPHFCANCDITFDIIVPKNVSVVASTGSGAIHASNVGGGLRLDDASGDISVEHAGGALFARSSSGNITVDHAAAEVTCRAASGRINVTGARGDLDAHSASGDVSARFADLAAVHSIALETASGSISLAMPRGAGATINASTISGSIASDFGLEPREGFAGATLQQKIGDGRVKVQIEVVSGDVNVHAI